MQLPEALDKPLFKILSQAAEALQVETYVIGGFVRDFLLGRPPKRDIDIVCVGSGIELARETAARLPGKPSVSVFKKFGTAMLKFRELQVEFVGARKESYRADSRKPLVENGSLQDDQNRRDFTINALALSLQKDSWGTLTDLFDGLKDLKNRLIRTPLAPEVTYSDDPLRMLRAIRFAAQLNFSIEPHSFQALTQNKDRIRIVSTERILDEFNQILFTEKPSRGLLLLEKSGLLPHILPELQALKGIDERDGQTHKDNFYHTLEVVDNISVHTDDLWLRWAALLHDIGKAVTKKFDKKIGWTFHGHEFVGGKMVSRIFRRLKLPLGPPLQYVQKLITLSARPIALVSEKATDSAIRRLLFDAGEDIDNLMTLCNADITTKNKRRYQRYRENFQRVCQRFKEVEQRDQLRNWQPPIDGTTIMKTFNLPPGREIGILKTAIREAILEGEIPNQYEAAYDFMLRKAAHMGLQALKNYS